MEPQNQAHHTQGAHTSLLDLSRDLAVCGPAADQQGQDLRDPPSITTLDTSTNTSTASRASSTSSLLTPSSSSTRLPGTPPVNPPRFLTRPNRRTFDHSHHGSGYNNGQNSSSMSVRSAFKDFVVPVQIILVCSILNALWPTLLRIIATTIEFLVLVLSSYGACARRSDDCYFLEPLFNDGQEGIYLGTIQWTLRGVFCIVLLSGVYLAGKKVSKIWSALTSTRQRPRPLQGPDGLCPWLMTYPSLMWRYFARLFPWRITRSGQSGRARSVEGTRHQRKTSAAQSSAHSSDHYHSSGPKSRGILTTSHNTTLSYSKKTGAFDVDAFSAGSGSESKARSRTKARRPKVIEDLVPRDSLPKETGSDGASPNRSSPAANTNNLSEPTTPTLSSEAPIPSAVPAASTIHNNSSLTVDTTSGAAYKTVGDSDFIPTDKRRRKRTKGHKGNPAAASSESLIKSSTLDQEPSATSVAAAPQSTPPISPAPGSTKTSGFLGTSAPFDKPSEEVVAQQKQSSAREQIQPRSSSLCTDKTQISPTSTTTASVSTLVKDSASLLPSTPDNTFVHPIHALNSTSPIVRLKPSHKRSQSAQLPSLSPWSIPASSSSSSNSNRKSNHGSSLNKTTLPDSFSDPAITVSDTTIIANRTTEAATNTSKDTTVVTPPSVDRPATNNSKAKDYDPFAQSSSIWYSPFQSGLDISIENDHEHGKHGSRPLSKPKIQIDASVAQQRSNLAPPLLTPSSFFESSPRAPRIMPFSQHHSGNTLGLEDWSAQNGMSSVTASMTPLSESDPSDPMVCFDGSCSVSSSRRGSAENNLTESLLSGRARMFASSEPCMAHPQQISQRSYGSSESISESLSDATFLAPQYGSSLAPASAALFASSGSLALGQAPLDSSASTPNVFLDTGVDTLRAFVNPWESNFPYQSTHAVSDAFFPFGSLSTTNIPDSSIDWDRQHNFLRLMNGDSRVEGSMSDGSLLGTREPDHQKEAIRRGFLFPSLTHHTQATLHSNADISSFRPFASVEMSLAAAANQPPLFVEDLKYDADLSLQNLISQQAVALESNSAPVLVRTETSERRPKDRHRHGRSRSGHHKSASLSSFFPPLPPAPGAANNSSSGSQATTGNGTLDPLNQLSLNNGGEGRHHGSHGHGHGHFRHGRSSQSHGSSKEADGVPSTTSKRRVGTDQESQPRGSSKQRHHDSSKSKRMSNRI